MMLGTNSIEQTGSNAGMYERANPMEVCHKLWNSWEPDAVVADKETGVFVDASKVHPINHNGKWFSCPGISAVELSPQLHPVLFQAGASGPGRDFCAKHAEAAFGVQLTTRAGYQGVRVVDNQRL